MGNLTAVSYTHLRAHETSLHLVCRLLLEKIKHRVNQSRIGWKDPTGCQMFRFRSIDVQRALSVMITESEPV